MTVDGITVSLEVLDTAGTEQVSRADSASRCTLAAHLVVGGTNQGVRVAEVKG